MIEKQKNNYLALNRVPSFSFLAKLTQVLCALLMFSAMFIAMPSLAFNLNVQIPLQNQFKNVDTNLRAKIAQKLFLDLRYYCAIKASGYCQEPLLSLPPELALMLEKSKVGGVILFSENLSSAEQIVNLVHQLQTSVMPKNPVKQLLLADSKKVSLMPGINYVPLYIGIDQEGGRVSRLPQNQFLGFAGNMAIGATFAKHKGYFAKATSEATAKQLSMLGINVNFAPVIDVNNNPLNPIINVRAYGQFPKMVASLGGDSIHAMQQQGISVAAKHFPGHGDTVIDSHDGLPQVNHKRDIINKVDLFPFRAVISNDNTRPDMIMTAHIQYPELDDTPFVSDKVKDESLGNNVNNIETSVLPATLSHKILTGILRNEYAYSGLIVTDALNMKSITEYLSPAQAVIKSFRAGADITLMPYHISSAEDAIGFLDWLNQLTILVSLDDDLKGLVDASYDRIVAHKAKRKIAQRATMALSDKLKGIAENALRPDEVLATALSQASFTQIKALRKSVLPSQKVLALMPDKRRCHAFEHYWTAQGGESVIVRCVSLLSENVPLEANRLDDVDVIIVGDVSPQLAWYESAEFEGITANQRIDYSKQQTEIGILLLQAKELGVTTILTKLRSPYISEQDIANYDGIFASYDYQVTEREYSGESLKSSNLFSPAFASLVKVITGNQQAQGNLPVVLAPEVMAKLLANKPPISSNINKPTN